ncbi:hypothetical protein H2199_005597 [Coniosporium tulheliwenetii]|uniref:Uncharacterized protein n=1 Tax=Coniosporium tulheliwenetii TaxID=3383036 RepID=A0ACC2Z0H2_9PEZI|nr:hypothetical protein H2199_005597 [Cladosporium sp. JES 115]
MMKIQALLNPLASERDEYRQTESPVPRSIPHSIPVPRSVPRSPTASTSRSYTPSNSTSTRQKVSKDAAVFVKGKLRGEINYPPYEAEDDEELATKQKAHQIHPMGSIADYCRHIPYNSEKKDFLMKTGREGFDVFQYTFKVRGDDKEYVVMWDYNIGLTTPARVLNLNPGLRDITHSITGGALVAQGYWMPYEAAKAVAATFCHDIRYALTPIFGKDFVSICTLPSDANFASFRIDSEIVRRCTAEANRWRLMGMGEARQTPARSTPCALPTPRSAYSGSDWSPKPLRPRVAKITDVESGYGTDTDQSENYECSPRTIPKSRGWTSVNRLESPKAARDAAVEGPSMLCSPTPYLSSVPGSCGGKRTSAELDSEDAEDVVPSIEEVGTQPSTMRPSLVSIVETGAANILMCLRADANAALPDSHRDKRARRASA